jgi:hypothetical protein
MNRFIFSRGFRLLPAAGALLLGCVVFTGCSGSATTNTFSGKIMFNDGKPLHGGFMFLNYADQKQPVRTMINPDGSYRFNNIPTGKATITLDNTELKKQADMMRQKMGQGGLPPGVTLPAGTKTPEQMQKEMGGNMPTYDPIDPKYTNPKNSPLTWDIVAGNNTKDFTIDRPKR